MPTQRPAIPALQSFPEYRAESEQLSAIRQQKRELDDQIEEMRGNPPRLDGSEQVLARDDAAIKAILGGDAVSDLALSIEAWKHKLANLRERRRLLDVAEKAQIHRLNDVRNAVTERVVPTVRPYYRDVQQRIADALVVVGELAEEEAEIRAELHAAGYAPDTHLGPNPPHRMRLADPNSIPNGFIENARRLHGVKVPA